MKLSLRLFWVLARALARGPLDPLAPSVTRWRVLPGDLDLFGHMNNGRYLAIMDLARIDLLVRAGMLPKVLKKRWIVPIGGAVVEFHGSLRPFESYEIHTQLVSWDERWFYFRQEFRRSREPARVVSVGYVKAVFRGAQGSVRPCDVVAELRGGPQPRPALTDEVRRAFALEREHEAPSDRREPVAIVGIGCRLPGDVHDPDGLWSVLMEGRECIVDIPGTRWDPARHGDPAGKAPGRSYVQRAGLLCDDSLFSFDPGFFGITPREAGTLDPQQRLLLETSWEALEDAGVPPPVLAGSRTGVFIGGFMTDSLLIHSNPDNRERISTHSATANTLTMLSNRLSYVYDLRGPSMSLDTACSSSLVAIHQACQSLWSGESDAALAGGVNVILVPETQVTMAKGKFLSPRGRCHAFSDQADGYVRAEGAAVLLLKPLSAALRDGDRIYATILGTAANQDGRTAGITVPSGEAQIAVMREAYRKAGVDPAQVVYVEAHGTGTPAGDPIEARAIGAVVGAGRPGAPCWMGSVKTNLGHLEAAAGVTAVIKAALCLRHGIVPPHLHLSRVNPEIPLAELGLRIPTRPEDMPRGAGPRVAGVNSFGYGGTNAHVVLGEAPPTPEDSASAAPRALLPLSAKSPEALAEQSRRYAAWIEAGRGELGDVCRSAAVHRVHHRHRLVVRADTPEAAVAALRGFAGGERTGEGRTFAAERPPSGRALFVYTGMGPQWWAMGRQLYAREPVYRAALDACDADFRKLSGWSLLAELNRDEGGSRIARTEVAQPTNTALQIALTAQWRAWGVVPEAIVGHSIGEVGAAHASGALTREEALRVAYHRSRLQQRLSGAGTMLAVGLGPDEAAALVERHGGDVAVGAVNSARAVTLAGSQPALARVAAELEGAGVFCRFLRVDVPYHSPVMDRIEAELRASLRDLCPAAPVIPIYSTVTGARIEGAAHDADYWFRNARGTVRFRDAILRAAEGGHDVFVEIGPHPVLASSIRDCLAETGARGELVATLVRGADEVETTGAALARLYALGRDVDWKSYFGSSRYTPVPKTAFDRQRHWSEGERSLRRRVTGPRHPMIVDETRLPAPGVAAELSLAALPYLADHVAAGAILFPGAGHVELALALRHALTGDPRCAIEGLELLAAAPLAEGQSSRLTLSLSPDTPAFRVHLEAEGRPALLCAQGKLFSSGRAPAPVDVNERTAPLGEVVERDALYAALARRGLCYGPAFRGVQRVRRGAGEIAAELVLPDGVDGGGYHLHPALLDAAFHSLFAALPEGQEEAGDVLPVRIERVQVFAPAGRRALALGRMTRHADGSLRGDLTLVQDDGRVIAEVSGFTCKLLPRAAEDDRARLQRRLVARRWAPVALAAVEPARWCVLEGAAEAGVALQAALAGGQPAHVLDLRWASPAAADDPVAQGTDDAAALLRTLQALPVGSVARYVLVTQRAEAALPGEAPALARAPLLGLARTAMSERPDLRVSLVDLDAAPSIAALKLVVARLGREQEVALRDGDVLALRLAPGALAPDAPARMPAAAAPAYALIGGESASLDALDFAACARPAPGPGEVEIAVEVASLGFKDVMKVLGLISERVRADTYFGASVGMEGAGRISAVGPGVEGLALGERVYGVAPAFLRSHVVLPAGRVVKLPEDMSFEEGSNLIVFLTVYYGLVKIARLQRGETVLIHGATGGVGLAAIEVARGCGAAVIATAGTEEKRDHLRRLGIERVSHSRDLCFADDVRAWTGGRGVDVVLNFTPGEGMLKSLECLAPFGRFIELGKMSFDQDAALGLRPFNDNLLYAAVDFDRILAQKPEEVRAMYLEVMQRFAAGDLRPLPSTCFAASAVGDAFRHMARGRHIGKVCVALRDPELTVPAPARPVVDADATYLVTGGLGGFGLEVARWLAEQGARHLALVSRRGAAAEGGATALAELCARGVEARAFAADVSDAHAVAAVLAAVREAMPPLRGVFHAAAVFDDQPLASLDRGSLERVIAPKAHGAWHLHRLTADDPLHAFVLFSSVSALIGNAGQGNYVAANAFLDALAALRRSQGLPGCSVQWGALADAGVVARHEAVAQHLGRLGVTALPAAEALRALGAVLSGAPAQIGVMEVDWARLRAHLDPWAGTRRLDDLAPETGAANATGGTAGFAALDDDARHALAESALLRAAASVMRVPADKLEPTQPLHELGMDSIMAVEIAAEVERQLGVRLSAVEIASGPPIRAMATILAQSGRLAA